ncbi:hypothetical protein ACSEE7_12650 [Halomonas cupida]|uniref:hypothetical protein n=1 Tax=Halomonas cupida TaxID=44933 RepID=UPI003EF4B09F
MSNEIESQAIIEVTESVTIIETSADINSPIYAEAARTSAAEAKASEVSAAEDAAATAADRVQTGLDRQAASDSADEAKASEQAAKASENAAEQDAQATASDRTYIDGKVAHVDSQAAHVDDQVSHVDEQATFVDQRATDANTSATAAAASESAASASAASAAADATQTADDRRQTGEDRTQTGLDRTAASDSATAAADSAALADQHRQTAAESEANAAQSESAAQDHLNAFLDRYYGDYAAPPTESPTGNAPEVGDLYFDTTEGALKIWTSAGWRNATTVVEGVYDVHEYRDQAGNNSFALDYDVGLLQVLYNGVQLASDDFTANNGTSVVLAKAVTKNTDVITLIRWGAVTQATFIGTAAREDVEAFDPAGAAAQAETNAKAYTDMEIASLVAAAPGALDTLNELAQALGDDPNFAATMTNALAQKLDASAYTASDVLAKLLTVDGPGSGLDADLLDGQPGYLYARRDQNNTIQTDSGGVRLVGADDRGYLQGLDSAGENGGLWLTGILGAKAPRIELYSDQVTIAGNQVLHSGNTENYARLVGPNNFGQMPSVNGDPIIEEDSNSDGSWTRLASGSQFCRAVLGSATTSSTGSYTWNYPAVFLFRAFPSAYSEVSNNTSVETWQPTVYGTEGESQTWYVLDKNLDAMMDATTGRAHFFAFGKWK